jgi:hypothetical protein
MSDSDEITGMDLPRHPELVTDMEDSDKEDDEDAFVVDPPGLIPPSLLEVDETSDDDGTEEEGNLFETHTGHIADEEDESSDNEDDSMEEDEVLVPPMEQRQYPLWQRVRKKRTIIDFDGRTYQESKRVVHVNPSIIKDRREVFRKSRVIPIYGIKNRLKITIPTLKGQRTQTQLTWDLRSFRASDLKVDDFDVEQWVVMHVVGVIMAQQYTIRKGLNYSGAGADKLSQKS